MTETTKIENLNQSNSRNLLNIELGTAANLVKGYAPGWNPAVGKLDILHRPKEQPMAPQPIKPFGKKGHWGYPVISLHETAESLITELLGYKIDEPAIDDAPPSLPAGSLILSSPTGEKAKKALTETLGVSLEDTTLRYALVKLTRFDETLLHTTKEHGILTTVDALKPDLRIGVNADFMRTMARLYHFSDISTKLTPEDANAYLAQFSRYGTHFVSSISMGDQIIQVFAYDATRFAEMKEGFEKNNFSGSDAVGFKYYTTNVNAGRFGYVQQYGKIICLSNSPSFQESLNTGKWHENFWAKHNSVFQIFSEDTKISRLWLKENLTKQAPIGLTLAPMTTFTEYKRATVWRQIFKAAMSTVFGDTINPNFKPQDKTDFSALIPEDYPGFISTIATPTINIYKTRLSLPEIQLNDPNEVKNFLTYGYVVVGRSKKVVNLPGNNVCLCGYILDMRADGQPNKISLNVNGFNNLLLSCAHFLGAARFQAKDGSQHFLVVDGLRYDLDEKGDPIVINDIRCVPPATFLPNLKDSLEFSLAFGDAVLSVQNSSTVNSQTEKLARDYLRWVVKLIPADTGDNDLLIIRFRAFDLSNNTENKRHGTFVPILPATDYEKSVNKILNYLTEIQRQIAENTVNIKLRKQAELTIDTAKSLNENILQTGKILSGMIKTNFNSAIDVSNQYEAIIDLREAESKQKNEKINELSSLVFSQQAEVDSAVQRYKAAFVEWQTMEAVKFGLDVATNILNVATTIMIPSKAISGVKDIEKLAKTFQRIQKTMNLINAVGKVYTSISDNQKTMRGAQKTLQGLDNTSNVSIDTLGWEELSFQIDAVMSTAPNSPKVNEAKANVVAAVKILSARGKALVNAKSDLLQIRREIYTIRCQKELNQRQLTRLESLINLLDKADLAEIKDLNREQVDLVGLTGTLDYLSRQMFRNLAKTFLLQDGALQYQWMQAPTPITSYSILNLSKAIVDQNEATIAAKSELNRYQVSTTKPIIIDIRGVPKEDIIDGNVREITLNPNMSEFSQYVNLRVHAVVAEVLGVKSTTSKNLQVKLTFDDQPFTDRHIRCTDLRFHTPSRERIYEFNVLTGERNFDGQGESWSEGVSPVTPFGAWLVSLPNTNENLVFTGRTVDIRLTFILKARIVDKCIPSKVATHDRVRREANVHWQPSEESLMNEIANAGSVTNGWDVVFNMKLEAINKILEEQYKEMANNSIYQQEVNFNTPPIPDDFNPNEKRFSQYKFKYGYPKLLFKMNNGKDLELKMKIIEGSITACREITTIDISNQKVKNIEKASSKDLKNKDITADIALELVEGKTSENNKVLDVKLIMKKGSFSVENIQLKPEEEVNFNLKLKDFFTKNQIEFLINRLDLTHIPVIDDMRPNGFLFKLLKTPSKVSILQLFIQTGRRNDMLGNYTLAYSNIKEPLPLGYETSLFINNKLFFSSIFPKSLDKSNSTWRLKGCPPSSDEKSWWGEFTSGSVLFNVDINKLAGFSASPGGSSITSEARRYELLEKSIRFNLKGKLQTQNDGQIIFNDAQVIDTSYHSYNTVTVVANSTSYSYTTKSFIRNSVKLNIRAIGKVEISSITRNQEINFIMGADSVTVSGHLSGGGDSGSDNIAAAVNQITKEQVPPQIISQINNIKFNAVSVFALKNLLFPSNNYIEFKKASLPGDMLILGNFSSIKDN